MKALVKQREGEGGLEVVDWPEPTPRADEVLIELQYAGICGTDLHILKGHWPCRKPVHVQTARIARIHDRWRIRAIYHCRATCHS